MWPQMGMGMGGFSPLAMMMGSMSGMPMGLGGLGMGGMGGMPGMGGGLMRPPMPQMPQPRRMVPGMASMAPGMNMPPGMNPGQVPQAPQMGGAQGAAQGPAPWIMPNVWGGLRPSPGGMGAAFFRRPY
jgi:hypothetical protein